MLEVSSRTIVTFQAGPFIYCSDGGGRQKPLKRGDARHYARHSVARPAEIHSAPSLGKKQRLVKEREDGVTGLMTHG